MKTLAKDPAMKKRRQAIADPTRMRILGLISESEGLTAKELGKRLRMDPNRLYWHMRILEEAEVIQVAELRPTGSRTERVYKEAYDGRWAWNAQEPLDLVGHMSAQMELAKIEGEEALFEQAKRVKKGEKPPIIVWARAAITASPTEIEEFNKRLNDLMAEFRDRAKTRRASKSLRRMRFTYVLCEQSIEEDLDK